MNYLALYPFLLVIFFQLGKKKIFNPIFIISLCYFLFFFLRYFYLDYKWENIHSSHTYDPNPYIDVMIFYSSIYFLICISYFLIISDKIDHVVRKKNFYEYKYSSIDIKIVNFITFISLFSSIYFIIYSFYFNNINIFKPAIIVGDIIPVDRWKGLYFFKILSSFSYISFFFNFYFFN